MTAERLSALVFQGHGKCFIQGTSGSLCGGWAGPAGACCALTHPLFSGCRGLRFIQVFLQSICDGERDENHPNLIRVNATKAYEMALKKYHGWIVQKIFQAALYAAPYKSDFLKALSKGQNVTEEECLEKIRLFLVNYTATIDVIYEMYTRMNAELNYKV